jgi:hypothetical protein
MCTLSDCRILSCDVLSLLHQLKLARDNSWKASSNEAELFTCLGRCNVVGDKRE